MKFSSSEKYTCWVGSAGDLGRPPTRPAAAGAGHRRGAAPRRTSTSSCSRRTSARSRPAETGATSPASARSPRCRSSRGGPRGRAGASAAWPGRGTAAIPAPPPGRSVAWHEHLRDPGQRPRRASTRSTMAANGPHPSPRTMASKAGQVVVVRHHRGVVAAHHDPRTGQRNRTTARQLLHLGGLVAVAGERHEIGPEPPKRRHEGALGRPDQPQVQHPHCRARGGTTAARCPAPAAPAGRSAAAP